MKSISSRTAIAYRLQKFLCKPLDLHKKWILRWVQNTDIFVDLMANNSEKKTNYYQINWKEYPELERKSWGWSQTVQHSWCNILPISALLSKNEKVVGENNSVPLTMLYSLAPA